MGKLILGAVVAVAIVAIALPIVAAKGLQVVSAAEDVD